MSEMNETTLYCLAAALSAFTLALYIFSLYGDYTGSRKQRRLASVIEEQPASPLLRIVLPAARFLGHLIASYLAQLEQRWGHKTLAVYATRLRVRVQKALIAAGNPQGLTADEMIGLTCFSAIVWTVAGIIVGFLLGTSFLVLVFFVIGVVQPITWLRGRMNRRRNEIRRLMPYALDLLTLSVEAGLDFAAALDRMVPKLEGSALAQEFGEMLRQLRLGKSRTEALREMADRVGMSEVTSFCSSLVQAVELGADLGPVLRVLADQMRNDRSNRAEKKAMEAPVKILFPLIAFIFPTVFLLLFGSIGMKYIVDMLGG